jgi:hypothetical protein
MLKSVSVASTASTEGRVDVVKTIKGFQALACKKEEERDAAYVVIREVFEHLRSGKTMNKSLGLLLREKCVDAAYSTDAEEEEATDVVRKEEKQEQFYAKLKLVRHWTKTEGLDVFDSTFILALLCRYCYIVQRSNSTNLDDEELEYDVDDFQEEDIGHYFVCWSDNACRIIDERSTVSFAKNQYMSVKRALSSLLLFALEKSTVVNSRQLISFITGDQTDEYLDAANKFVTFVNSLAKTLPSPASARAKAIHDGASGSKKRAVLDSEQEHTPPPSKSRKVQ